MSKKKAKIKKKRKSSSSASTGRDDKGHFIKGNKVSVGNLGKSSEHARHLKQLLLSTVSDKDAKVIFLKMVKQAKEGDAKARSELFDRLWGKAPQAVDFGDKTRKTIFDILAVCGLNGGNGN